MVELAKVTLQNEMDLILAHRRSMRLAELAGLSLSSQTTFATAVSEVARGSIEFGKNACLVLCVSNQQADKYIIASVRDEAASMERQMEGVNYAKRLVNRCEVVKEDPLTTVNLFYHFTTNTLLDSRKIDEWKSIFRNEPPVSAYEEIKRKNEQLQELTQRLEESEAQYKTLTDSLPLLIFSVNLQGELIYANRWTSRYTGQNPRTLNGTAWENVVHPDDLNSFLEILKSPNLVSDRNKQIRLRNAKGEDYVWHLLSLTALKDDNGNPGSWIGYLVDIDAQKKVEETLKDNQELKAAQAELKKNQKILEENIQELNRSNTELKQFAFVASHDLQEPVRKISIYSDYFVSKYSNAIDARGTEYLKGMQSASYRMRNLIHDLLAFSQVNRQKTAFKKISLEKVMKEVLQDLELTIREKGAQITSDPLPEIEADQVMMRQLLENIVSNALKYSKEGTPSRVEIKNRESQGNVIISITDNGIGFDEKYLPQMFTLFQRLHSNDKYQGTGLGLAICRKIVALHNGSITASGKTGIGATFTVTLPISNHDRKNEERT